MFPMLCLRWAQLGVKLSPKCSKLWHVGLPCASHCFNLRPNLTNLGSSRVQDSATWGPSWASLGAARAQVGPNPANFADSLRHAENLHFYRYFQRFLALVRVRVGPCCPHLSCTQLQRQMPPHRTKLRMLSPTCVQNVPKLCHVGSHVGPQLGSSWAQVEANWPEFGASYAQVGPKLAPVVLMVSFFKTVVG